VDQQLLAELGLEGEEIDIKQVLALAGVAAHSIVRPAAPLTTFVAGYAAGLQVAGAGAEPRQAASAAMEVARVLAMSYGSQGRTV
jgi:hypothetical protein